jgi:hypothetical protein
MTTENEMMPHTREGKHCFQTKWQRGLASTVVALPRFNDNGLETPIRRPTRAYFWSKTSVVFLILPAPWKIN